MQFTYVMFSFFSLGNSVLYCHCGILLPFTWHFASLEYSYFKFIVFHAGFQLNQCKI